MSSVLYDALARAPWLRTVERAFRDATGLSLKLVPSGEPLRPQRASKDANAFCGLMATSAGACAACTKVQRELQRRFERKLAPRSVCCFAGMTELAVPVVVGGQHVATLLGGQVFRQKPSRRQFDRVARQIRQWTTPAMFGEIRRAYFQTPVVSAKALQGALRLLTVLAAHLAESASRQLLATHKYEPLCVTQAKQFVQAHAGERVTSRRIAEHVHVSQHHFCKVFKQGTGMTVTEFVARVRVEKAKGLLGDPQLRVTDVADRAGFNSISQFNRVFRRYAGSSPTDFRTEFLRRVGVD